ncbi:holliday junction resolvase [Pteropox virus]|uniref:Holliday junction resolvase n=1 Tax=Pteropox virus TaxID=1873698 RepID=A0A1B1MRI1_9POXV|nr:holliday junction resolvase [Pteropox virus]ANS71201.1 holliday junction resolvase [Pteropox virus]
MQTKDIKKIVISAYDIGVKNPARTVLEIFNDSIRVVDITKLDWSNNWESKISADVRKFESNIVLLERQSKKSPYSKFVYFIKGLLYNTNTKVYCVPPVMKGSTYKSRKRRSIKIFLKWLTFFDLGDYVPVRRKMDDVADSFNIAMRYVIEKYIKMKFN